MVEPWLHRRKAPIQQRLAVGGAPLAGVAFCAAPIAVPIEMGKEGWRERPRLGAMHASRAPRGVAHATVSGVRVGVPIGALSVRKIRARRGAFFLTCCGPFECSKCAPDCVQDRRHKRGPATALGARHAPTLMRACHGRVRSVIADGLDVHGYTHRLRRSLPHCVGASARVKATLRRSAALTRASRSPE